jgi:hypothetical protein
LNCSGELILFAPVPGGSGERPDDLDSSKVWFEDSKGCGAFITCMTGSEGLFYLNFDYFPVGLLILFDDIKYYCSSFLCLLERSRDILIALSMEGRFPSSSSFGKELEDFESLGGCLLGLLPLKSSNDYLFHIFF